MNFSSCRINYTRKAQKDLNNLPKEIMERILERLRWLSKNPICEDKLKLADLCKTRVGSYRIIYRIGNCNIDVIAIGKRESIYDELRRFF
jgi:mRNA-degrading endonuclease RelE of RelBE toxin-antitoxin system